MTIKTRAIFSPHIVNEDEDKNNTNITCNYCILTKDNDCMIALSFQLRKKNGMN